jgi:hypothetical protein
MKQSVVPIRAQCGHQISTDVALRPFMVVCLEFLTSGQLTPLGWRRGSGPSGGGSGSLYGGFFCDGVTARPNLDGYFIVILEM